MSTFLTGNKDVDRIIFNNLSDKDILEVYKINKYTYSKVCDEIFFRNLVYERYPGTVKYKDYVKISTWKSYFITNVYYVDKLKNYKYDHERHKKFEMCPELEYLARKASQKPEDNKLYKGRALIEASRIGNLTLVKYIAERGKPVQKFHLNNALTEASRNGHLSVVKYLVEREPNIDRALKCALQNNYLHVAEFLIDFTDNMDIVNSQLEWSCEYGFFSIVNFLVEHGADIHYNEEYALAIASRHGYIQVVKYLVEHGANVQAQNNQALRLANSFAYFDVVYYLIEKGADINVLPNNDIVDIQKTIPNYEKYLIGAVGFVAGLCFVYTAFKTVKFISSHN